MSTRIGNGVRFINGPGAMHGLEALRPRIVEAQARLTAKAIAGLATAAADRAWANHATATDFLQAARDEIEAARTEVRIKGFRSPRLDHDVDVTVIDAGTDGVLGFPVIESDEIAALLAPLVEPFGYWDGTDRPPSVDGPEWARRRAVWEGAIGPDMVPARHGEAFRQIDESRPTDALIVAAAPPRRQRARALATGMARNAYAASLGPGSSMDEVIDTLGRFDADAGQQAAIATMAAQFEPELPDAGLDHLTGRVRPDRG